MLDRTIFEPIYAGFEEVGGWENRIVRNSTDKKTALSFSYALSKDAHRGLGNLGIKQEFYNRTVFLRSFERNCRAVSFPIGYLKDFGALFSCGLIHEYKSGWFL